MTTLKEKALSDGRRAALVNDAVEVLNAEVRAKTGLTGMAVGAAFKVLEGIKPGFVRQAVDDLLDSFLDALDPLYQESVTQGVKPGAHLLANQDRAAEALLAVTDARAERREVADRAAEAAAVREYANRFASHDPRFAADLMAAADRHERLAEQHVPYV